MIQIQNESLIAFSDLPRWCEENIGRRISPSTLHRWRLKGCRGIKLETLLIGGIRTTSAEALQRFFDRSTVAQDGSAAGQRRICHIDQVSHEKAVEFLGEEGLV